MQKATSRTKKLRKTFKRAKHLYKGMLLLSVLIAAVLTGLAEYRSIEVRSGR